MRKKAPSKTRSELEELKNLLDQKNRELEVEAALERIRSSAMAMNKTDKLAKVVKTIFQELKNLNFDPAICSIGIYNKESKGADWWISDKSQHMLPRSYHMPYMNDPWSKSIYSAWKNQLPVHTYNISGKAKLEQDRIHFEQSDLKYLPESTKNMISSADGFDASYVSMKHGMLEVVTEESLSKNQIQVLQRLGKVIDLTYTRFKDLQKAEEQVREAQIEAALERVRSKSMAMHRSEELAETAAILFQQFDELGVRPERINIGIVKEAERIIEWWSTEQGGKQINELFKGSIDEPTTLSKVYSAWKKGEESMVLEQSGKKLKDWLQYLTKELGIPFKQELKQERRYQSTAFFTHGMILMSTPEPLSKETLSLLPRFAKVFEQTYRRFLDLQKAEAQAREAQIEASLERVRSKAMAMHSTKDISDATAIVFNELTRLGVEMVRCGIGILHDTSSQLEIWSTPMSPKDKKVKEVITGYVESNSHPMIQSIFEAWRNNESYFAYTLHANEVRDYYDKLGKLPGYRFPKITKYPDRQMAHCFYFEHGNIFVYSEDDLSEEQKQLLHRFAKVFSLTYKRYLDLKNAESQVREAHIEAALERVRSKTMAMHNSHDVGATIVTLFDEVLKLGIDDDIRCGIGILEASERMETWSATSYPNGEVDLKMGMLDMTIHPLLKRIKKAWECGETHYTDQMTGKSLVRYYAALNNEPDYSFHINLDTLPKKQYHNSFSFPEGILFSFSPNPMSEEAAKVLNRFARVFGQTYRRYVDLLKAEEQAREAQIEAALERIRSKALAMQSSADLHGVSMVLREQMGYLGQQELESSLIHLYNNSKTLESWYTFRSTETNSTKVVTDVAIIPVNSCEYIRETLEKYHSKEMEYTIVSKGKKLVDWYKVMVKVAPDTIEYDTKGKMLVPDILYYHHSKFIGGALLMISNEKPSEEAKELQRRAAKVFNLAYQRFIDFQQAEERARESLKQASLDRVRGEIASMRSKEDLNRITPLLWKELTALGVPFIRCGVFIMNEKEKYIESHLSAPDGKSLGVLNLPYDANEVGNNAVKYWRKGEIYTDHWNKKQFIKFMQKMQKIGQLSNPDIYQGSASPPESLDLHFVPFKQGMLYVGNTSPLIEHEIQLVKSLAEAFSIAYARYEDFTELEHAKNQIEIALAELKSTQSQLIQSEKMASLGELTAGIAHEIQNPLNFVNNFSEVSKELIEEMDEEMESGNMEEVKEITEDIKLNLDKIYHHGQRASSIVKGMLEHSRTSDRKKEQTDINVLADEYLRLAYHGLRAKDKTFNADFKTELEKGLPKINVIAQDISRVLLNMINNAFYTVSKKAQESAEDYVPTVTIRTKKNDKTIEIIVQDNGNGIPKDALDKIFQPFFTTKPTGEGTGLGLSLSYDIITKGHDGHLEVETEEGKGTRFVVILPIT